MKTLKTISVVVLAASIGLVGCSKKGCTDSTATNFDSEAKEDDGSCLFEEIAAASEPETFIPTVSSTSFGALIAVNTVTTQNTGGFSVDATVSTGVAVFSNDAGSTFITAGTVDLNDKAFSAQDNNSYVYTPEASDIGNNWATPLEWEGTGADWQAFTVTNNDPFATIDEISNDDNIDMASDYVLSSSSISGADSTLFAIYGPEGSVLAVEGGNVSSHTFTASELSALGAGDGFMQIVGLKYNHEVVDSLDYWLINETVRTESVTIE